MTATALGTTCRAFPYCLVVTNVTCLHVLFWYDVYFEFLHQEFYILYGSHVVFRYKKMVLAWLTLDAFCFI